MSSRRRFCAALVAGLVLSSISFVVAQSPVSIKLERARLGQVMLNAAADATVDSSFPDTPLGASRYLVAGYLSRPLAIQRAFVRFDLTPLAGASIDQARLELYLDSWTGAASTLISYCQVLGTWTEGTITWNYKPSSGGICGQREVGTSRGWVAWDVTALARAWLQGPNYGLVLSAAEGSINATRTFFSLNNGEGAPRLIVTYSSLTPTATASAAATLTPAITPTRTSTVTPTPGGWAALYAPSTAYAGGQVTVAGVGWPAGGAVVLELVRGPDRRSCGSGVAASNGTLKATCGIPSDYPVGNVTLSGTSGAKNGSASMTILAGPLLTLYPTSGRPGTAVSYSLSNWLPGASWRLDYAGAPVFGPEPLSASAFQSSFLVPSDRPSPLGSVCEVRASMIVLGQTVATAAVTFQSLSPQIVLPYSLSALTLPAGRIAPGQQFTVTGKISPAPRGPLSHFRLSAMWEDGEGHHWPVGIDPAIGPGGYYTISIRAPTVLGGDAWPLANAGDTLRVNLLEQGRSGCVSAWAAWPQHDPLELVIRPYDVETGGPIAALVSHYPAPETETEGPLMIEYYHGSSQITDFSSHEDSGAGQDALADAMKWRIMCGELDHLTQVATVIGASFAPLHPEEPYLQPQDFSLLQLAGSQWTLVQAGPGAAASSAASAAIQPYVEPSAAKGTSDPTPGRERFVVLVDGLKLGYGYQGKGEVYQFYLWYHPLVGYEDIHGNPIQMPIQVPMVKFSSGVIQAYLTLQGASFSGGEWYLIDLRPIGGWCNLGMLRLFEDPENPWKLQDVQLMYNGHELGSFQKAGEGGYGTDCEGNPGKFATVWEKGLPYPDDNLVEPGVTHYAFGIRLVTVQGARYEHYWNINLSPIPAWYKSSLYKNRYFQTATQTALCSSALFHGEMYPPGETKTELNFTLPNMGQQNNSAGVDSVLETKMVAGLTDWYETTQTGGLRSEALNHPGAPVGTKATAPGDTPLSWSSAGDTEIVRLDDVRVYENGWGVPEVVYLSVTLDLFFNAHLQHEGKIQVSPSGDTLTSLYVHPYAMITTECTGKLKILFGFGSASWSIAPSFGLGLPIYYVNGQVDDSAMCFYYGLQSAMRWKIGVGRLRIGGCRQTILMGPGHFPDSALCKDPPLPGLCSGAPAVSLATEEANDAPQPSIATDGFGHTQALWLDDDGQVVAARLEGLTWSSPAVLSTAAGADGPRLAYYGPDRALATWSETSLTGQILATATLTEVLRSLHVVYALWDGSHWSAPASLTSPTTGDSDLHLAACPATESGCPTGGEVTAVWTHDAAGVLIQRQFRTFTSRFSGKDGTWSPVQPVDPSSTASDTSPRVAYRLGKALVTWVRDPDRSLLTVQDRRVAIRTLDDISPVTIPTEFPGGVIDLDLAASGGKTVLALTRTDSSTDILGNRDYLYAAEQACPSCPWTCQLVVDSTGRAIRAEAPVVTLDAGAAGSITFRHLGIGPTTDELSGAKALALGSSVYVASRAPSPSDLPVGVQTGTGELAQVEFGWARQEPRFLSGDGAVYWDNSAVYDPLSDSTLVLTTRLESRAPGTADATAAAAEARLLSVETDSPVSFSGVPRLPDLAVVAMDVSPRYPLPGQTAVATAVIRNQGVAWNEVRGVGLDITATWDEGPGLGQLAGKAMLHSLKAGETITVTMALTQPVGGYDWPRTLIVTANPRQAIPEDSSGNNVFTTTVGGITPPTDLGASARPGQPVALLHWTPSADERVAGYRVYRSVDGGASKPAGSSFVAGWLDLDARGGHRYRYTVASFTQDGLESEPGAPVELRVSQAVGTLCIPLVVRAR